MWMPVIGAPVGLLFAILASLMISGWQVQHAVLVQVEDRWRPGETLALRVHVQDGDGIGSPGAAVSASLRRDDQVQPLAALTDVTGAGATQATIQVPAWTPGLAHLDLAIAAKGREFHESVLVELVATRPARRGDLTISTSVKNWSDDTEPQPEHLRITLRALGRLSAGFENTLLVRVTDPEGRPHVGPVEVHLIDGEFGPERAVRGAPSPVLIRASTDPQGLLRLEGLLSTDYVRLEVVVLAKDSPAEPTAKPVAEPAGATEAAVSEPVPPPSLGRRRFRLVSFAGAVRVDATPLAVAPGASLTIKARSLRARKPVFVDLHAPDGAWTDTLTPVVGPEPPREWSTAGLTPGLLQIEAYQFTTAPGESAALTRIHITPGDPSDPATLRPLMAHQRELLKLGRTERGFDIELERKYLDALEQATISPPDVDLARAWLLGTLPIEVLGPPVALASLAREQAAVVARKQRWAEGLRWFLLGGGGLFLLVTLVLIVLSHRRAAARLTGEIYGAGAQATIAHEIAQAQRAVLIRAIALVVTMALGLVLTVVVLDTLLWR